MSDAPGHGTGYEDALARRLAALEAVIAEREERAGRLAATIEDLTRDNAGLRLRASAAERRSGRAAMMAGIAWTVTVIVAALAAWLLFRP
jgi:hypothetical protein